jgi:hypothetical protein
MTESKAQNHKGEGHKKGWVWALVAHTYNPSYSGSRHQEDPSPKPAWASSSQDPSSKKPSQKKQLAEWLKVQALSSSPGTPPKKKKSFWKLSSYMSSFASSLFTWSSVVSSKIFPPHKTYMCVCVCVCVCVCIGE